MGRGWGGRGPEGVVIAYEEWEQSVPEAVRGDPLWSLRVYRKALYAAEMAREDATRLMESPCGLEVAPQLVRAVGSVAANIAEGYSRFSARERAHFYEYALGSAREGRSWYVQAARDLEPATVAARIEALSTLSRIITALILRTRPRVPTPRPSD